MSIWSSWRASQLVRRAAGKYAGLAWAEPAQAEVSWLSREVTAGDEDRARWELRYLRRAVSQLIAERDGWDDRIGAEVAREQAERLRDDPAVAQERLAVAERQYDLRLSRYREALRERTGGPLARRIAVELARTAAPGRPLGEAEDRLSALVEGELAAAQTRLADCFGQPELPEDVRPSELVRGDQ